MKKFITIGAAILLVLAVGVVYADETMPMANNMSTIGLEDNVVYAALDNGVTFTSVADFGIQCASEGGAAAGGIAGTSEYVVMPDEGLRYSAPDNGVTLSAIPFEAKCSWARGLQFKSILEGEGAQE